MRVENRSVEFIVKILGSTKIACMSAGTLVFACACEYVWIEKSERSKEKGGNGVVIIVIGSVYFGGVFVFPFIFMISLSLYQVTLLQHNHTHSDYIRTIPGIKVK